MLKEQPRTTVGVRGRPTNNQRALFNEHKRIHAIKF